MSTLPPTLSTSTLVEPDWAAVRAETVGHLQRLIQLETVNPPGNEMRVARYLEQVLTSEGIPTELFEPAPGRGALIARVRGNGAKLPVLMLAHMDVVGVERERWSVDPFGGTIAGGYLYGRGAIDDKGMLAVNLMTLLLLKRYVVDRGGTLARDVIFAATADEERGGELGVDWLITRHPESIRAEFALNEGGRIRIVDGKPLYVAIQNAEKVPHVVTVTARGPSGHASVPLVDNAITRLGRALAAIGAHREPLALSPTTREFFSGLARVWPHPEERAAMIDIVSDDPERVERAERVIARLPVLDAVLRNGISATMLHGGIKSNVIPSEASATLNVRTLPGESIDGVIARLQRAIGDPLVELVVTSRGEDAPASAFSSPMFSAIAESASALDPALTVVPYLSTGATESARLRSWGMQAYGILPFPLDPVDEERMHGHDERIPLDSLDFGTRLIYGAIVRIADA